MDTCYVPKRIVGSSILLFMSSFAASAQDKSSWTGIYAGAHAGKGWGDSEITSIFGSGTYETQGPIIGGQIGGNWQPNDWFVLGLEADASFSDINGDIIFQSKLGTNKITSELDSFGTVRARAGILVTPSTLFFGTGGLAWANWTDSVNTNSWSHDELGWAAGGGIETKLSDTISAKAEYIYMDFPSATHNGSTFDHEMHSVRLGVNYKFW